MSQLVDDLVAGGVLGKRRIIAAFREIERKDFVPEEEVENVDLDRPLPLAHGQVISQPTTVATMLELLDPKPGNRVLDIGFGSGWQTALLAHIVGREGSVVAYERVRKLYRFGSRNIQKYQFSPKRRVTLKYGDGTKIRHDVFDRIVAACSIERDPPPDAWLAALKRGGRMVIPVGNSIIVYKKIDDTTYETEEYPGYSFVPLIMDRSRLAAWRGGFIKGVVTSALVIFLIAIYQLGIVFPTRPIFASTVAIQEGSNASDIAGVLKRHNIIRSEAFFLWLVYGAGVHDKLSAGIFSFSEPMSTIGAIRALTADREEVTVVIPEGSTIRDIAGILELKGIQGASGFAAAAAVVGEGYLFPDTYRFYVTSSAESIVQEMHEHFQEKLSHFEEEIADSGRTQGEIVIMASIIEREVPTKKDKELISGIFWKRMADEHPLQVDATLYYELGKTSRELTREDLNTETPYNTYQHLGLPPGPISNPGIESIEAALRPKPSPYYFYLSGRDGTTHFARTFEEHIANRNRYLR